MPVQGKALHLKSNPSLCVNYFSDHKPFFFKHLLKMSPFNSSTSQHISNNIWQVSCYINRSKEVQNTVYNGIMEVYEWTQTKKGSHSFLFSGSSIFTTLRIIILLKKLNKEVVFNRCLFYLLLRRDTVVG